MKTVVLVWFFFARILTGQEFLFANHYTEQLTTNQHTSEVYFLEYFQVNGYYKANLRDMTVEPSGFTCLPVFPYKTNKMIYRENDTLHLIDFDRKSHRLLPTTDSINYTEIDNMFSPNGELVFIGYYIYSFKDSSMYPIKYKPYHSRVRWSSDSTFIVLHRYSNSFGLFLLEYSNTGSQKDTVFKFNPDTYDHNCDWDYDAKRQKLYYSTYEPGTITSLIAKVHAFDRAAQRDSIIFEFPKDKDPNCHLYTPGAYITDMLWSGNYSRLAFLLDYTLDAPETDIYTYWPDSNKTTRVTDGCMHLGRKFKIYWANDDTLIYCDVTQGGLYGIRVRGITAVDKEDELIKPTGYSLANYPNPFNGSTVIECSVPVHESGELQIFNTLGKNIRNFSLVGLKAGKNRISWDGKDFTGNSIGSGVYFAVFRPEKSSSPIKPLKLLYLK